MNTDAAEALQALCPMTPLEARERWKETGRLPEGWEIVERQCGDDMAGTALGAFELDWCYTTHSFENHDVIRRKPILTEAP